MKDYLPSDSIYMIEMSKKLSRTPMCKNLNHNYPIEVLQEELGK